MVNAARLTKALSIAMRKVWPRMLLSRSLEGRQLDPLRVSVGHELEVGVREGRIDLPRKARHESWLGRIVAVDDHELARDWLVALLDPYLPVDGGLAECIMIGLDTVDRGGSDLVGRLKGLDAI